MPGLALVGRPLGSALTLTGGLVLIPARTVPAAVFTTGGHDQSAALTGIAALPPALALAPVLVLHAVLHAGLIRAVALKPATSESAKRHGLRLCRRHFHCGLGLDVPARSGHDRGGRGGG